MKIFINDIDERNFARLAFTQHLFQKGTVGGEGKPAFSSTVLFPPTHPAVAQVLAAEETVAKEKWGAKAGDILTSIRANGKGALKDGNTKAEYQGFPGNKFVSMRSEVRPTVVDRDRSPLTEADGRIYSGCYANVQVEIWAMDNQYGKRINAQILGVQFSRDGDSFGGGAPAADPDSFSDLSAGGGEEAGMLAD
jgi:hypothetical protein